MPLRRPSLHEVARIAGMLRPLTREEESEIRCDLAIVGAGRAGLAAAVYAASEGLKTAGEVRSGSVKRCAAAVGEGSIAVESVHEVLKTYV